MVRAFAHGAMGRRIDPSWGGPIELFLIPASAGLAGDPNTSTSPGLFSGFSWSAIISLGQEMIYLVDVVWWNLFHSNLN